MTENTLPRVLTIAGSDSGGGAGIEADLKTFSALGVYGMAAITAVTAQNTVAVTGIHDIPPAFVAEQIADVASDIGVDAAKTGMLSTAAIIEAVAGEIARFDIRLLVVDPVMIAKSGDALLQESAIESLKSRLLPLAWIVTPNIPEAEILAGVKIKCSGCIDEAAKRIGALGPRFVLIKGGHLDTPDATDYLFDGQSMQTFAAPRIQTKNTHGTGCTYSAAIAAFLAKGAETPQAVAQAKLYLTGAIRNSLNIGKGHGPLNHAWNTPAG